MDSRGRLSLRFVPRSHFILHSAFCIGAALPVPTVCASFALHFAFCILHFALAQPRLSLRFVPRSHFILHFAFCILHWRKLRLPHL